MAPRSQRGANAPTPRAERARRRKFRRNFFTFVVAQLLIAGVAFLLVRDYMSDGFIKHAVTDALNQFASESTETKTNPQLAVPAQQPAALTAAPSQDVAIIQEAQPAVEPPAAPPLATPEKIVSVEPEPEPAAEESAASLEAAVEAELQGEASDASAVAEPVAEPEVVAATQAVPVAPEPAPAAEVQAAAPAVAPEPEPAVEEVAAAAVPVPDLSQAKNAAADVEQPGLADSQQKEGLIFRDCDTCPELVSIAPGQFMVGASGLGVAQPSPSASPQEVVVEKPFAIGRYEITFDDWDRCVSAGGCAIQPGDDGWGRARRPVIHVSYNDIVEQYLPWLSKVTGYTYRLPTEAEWELASQGGNKFGRGQLQEAGSKAQIACTYGNSSDVAAKTREAIWAGVGCNDGFVYTAPVGSLGPNSLGIYDMHGNVWEWVSDCWHATYETLEEKKSPTCKYHVLRGGSWASEFRFLPDGVWVGDAVAFRAAVRGWETSVKARNSIGFRVARSQL